MKFRTFRNTIAMVLFLGTGVTCGGCYAWWQSSLAREEFARRNDEEIRLRNEATLAADMARRAAEAPPPPTATDSIATTAGHWLKATGLRDVDKDALAALSQPVVDKIKDAAKGRPWKINVYADDGTRFNRLKIDLDRDEQDDESWTVFADGHIERKASSKDDGKFDGTFRLELGGWVDMAVTATAAATTTSTAPSTPNGLRPVDRDLLALRTSLPVQEKVKDATKGKPYKINLYSDDGQAFNRARIDLDRDDKWDESWTWKAEGVERQVAPADDERYTDVYRLQGEGWSRK